MIEILLIFYQIKDKIAIFTSFYTHFCSFETPPDFVANHAPILPHRTLAPPMWGGGAGLPPCQNLYG